MADHSKPTNTSLYTDYTTELDARFDDLAVGLDPAVTTATNIPTNTIRWNSVNSYWEKYNGSTWDALDTGYEIDLAGARKITTNSASPALTITQIGSGNALVVEDSSSPDATPFVVDANGNIIIGGVSAIQKINVEGSYFGQVSSNVTATTSQVILSRRRTGGASVISADVTGRVLFQGFDGANNIDLASISAAVDGTPGTNDMPGRLVFSTTADGASTPTERMRINSAGNIGIGTSSPVATFTINGNAKIGRETGGTPSSGTKLTLEADSLDGVSTPIEVLRLGWSDSPNFDQLAGAGTKISFYQPSSSIASEVAYIGSRKHSGIEDDQGASLVFATSAAGSTSSTPPTERMRIDTFGRVGIGGTPTATAIVYINNEITGGTISRLVRSNSTVQSDVTSEATVFFSSPATQAASFTLDSLFHFAVTQGTFGAGSSVTNQYGYIVNSNVIGATNNYGFYSNIPSGTGRWNFFANGTADNAFNGNTRFGGTTAPTVAVDVTGAVKATGNIAGGYVAHAAGTTAMAFGSYNVVRVTPNATATYTTTVPAAGSIVVLSILTSGTTSYTITFGTGFKSTGTLATGTTSARYFNLTFVSDGTNLIETARTVAIT